VLFVTLEDETGFLQCVVQPREREQFAEELRHAALIVKGRLHAVQQWRGVVVREVRVLTNVIGGYYGHPAMYGGTDTMELTVRTDAEDRPIQDPIFVS
jgi:DNA polymerase III alpha subunit